MAIYHGTLKMMGWMVLLTPLATVVKGPTCHPLQRYLPLIFPSNASGRGGWCLTSSPSPVSTPELAELLPQVTGAPTPRPHCWQEEEEGGTTAVRRRGVVREVRRPHQVVATSRRSGGAVKEGLRQQREGAAAGGSSLPAAVAPMGVTSSRRKRMEAQQ